MQVVDVSVILPFRDHEDKIGKACRNIAHYFRAHGQAFEIVAVDQGSGDNSQSVLALLRREIPELRVMLGRGYGAGSRAADGDSLVLASVEAVCASVATSLHVALERVATEGIDMYLVAETLIVCRQATCKKLILSNATRRAKTERDLLEMASRRGLSVRSYGPLTARPGHAMARFIASLMPHSTGPSHL
ncbi:MAG: hypothetical protein GY811_24670 [Myxococcales bacterium]|nr:hypothetical protein [Myxococcales bacterium]